MNFIHNKIWTLCVFLSLVIFSLNVYAQNQERDIYELKIYHLNNEQQEDQVDGFLKNAFIPALHKAGVKKVGVFKPLEGDSLSGKRIYALIPYKSTEELVNISKAMDKDKNYLSSGNAYFNAAYDKPPYERIETIVMRAFQGMPQLRQTNLTNAPEERIYELRSYESATENLFHNKVDMFNKGEIDIFTELDFNPIFFGEVVAGSNMPNLMYMTAFKDRASRDAHWEAFATFPEWQKMRMLKKYQNNVSKNTILFLQPTPYSEI